MAQRGSGDRDRVLRQNLDLLATMSDVWNEQTMAMLSIVLGMAAEYAGSDKVVICLEDVEQFMEKYEVRKEYIHIDEKMHMQVLLVEKSLPTPPEPTEGE